MSGAIVLLVVVASLVGFVVLYLLIDGETASPTVVDRATAERDARVRGGLDRPLSATDSEDPEAEPTDEAWGYSRLDE